jgi:hypothetical protein
MQLVTAFCKLSVAVKRRSYTMPLIPQLLRKYSTYQYMTKLEMTMQFYTFVLDMESCQYCTFSKPFGLYCYICLPVGVRLKLSMMSRGETSEARDANDKKLIIGFIYNNITYIVTLYLCHKPSEDVVTCLRTF